MRLLAFKSWVRKVRNSKGDRKKVIGVALIIIGLLALLTPLTPGSWLIFIGLELLGIRLAIWAKLKSKFLK